MLRAPTFGHCDIEICFGFRASNFEFGCGYAALGYEYSGPFGPKPVRDLMQFAFSAIALLLQPIDRKANSW
jgi:hypothetical protein